LSYLKYDEIKNVGCLVNHAFNTICRYVWIIDSEPSKKWINVLEKMNEKTRDLIQIANQRAKQADNDLKFYKKQMTCAANQKARMTLIKQQKAVAAAISTRVQVTATSRWDDTSDEEPINVIDGNPLTWWSSKQVDHVILSIDFSNVHRVLPVSRIAIFWGDDGGRIRPCSSSYEVQLSVP
jgi:hypothetical protein